MAHLLRILCCWALLPVLVGGTGPALALDIVGVQNAALDQPQINALLRRPGPPLGGPLTGIGEDPITGNPIEIFNIRAFFDTGASGVVLSEQTADFLGVQRSPGVVFEDVGVGGSAQFNVSEPVVIDLAPFTPSADLNNPATAATVYNQRFGPLRTQIGPLGSLLPEGVDVLGVPTMQGKVIVMDPKPVDAIVIGDLNEMRTYVYDPGTPFKPATAESDPGIPPTNRSIGLTFASFDRFTLVTPQGAQGPELRPNPFIGPDPLAKLEPNPPPDNTPGVTLTLGERQTTGSFLLDTGAAASLISLEQAGNLNVRYRPPDDQNPNAAPALEQFDPANPGAPGTELPNQFVLTLSGTGGNQTAAGFFLDSLLVRTQQGDPLNDSDPAHLRYLGAPVLVADISLQDPLSEDVLTLDGVFAMNFLVASVFLSEEPLTFGELSTSPFRWIVFDQPNATLALDVIAVPEPESLVLVAFGLVLIAFRFGRVRTR